MVFTAIAAAQISNHEALVGGKWSGMETKIWQDAGDFGTEKGISVSVPYQLNDKKIRKDNREEKALGTI